MATNKPATATKSTGARDANDATRHFFLNDISLWECSLRRDSEFRWGEHTPESCTTQTFRTVEPEVIEVDVIGEDEQQLMLRALVKLGIRVLPKDAKEDAEPLYTLESTFCADYFILSTPNKKTFTQFVDFNCIHNVWPFWRQHVFDTLKRASLPIPTVPLYAGQNKYRRKRVNVKRVVSKSGELATLPVTD